MLRRDGGDTEIKFKELDVADEDSRAEMIDCMKRDHPQGIDALVNNAGIALDGFGARLQLSMPSLKATQSQYKR